MIATAVEPATEGQCILGTSWYCGKTTVGREKSLQRALARIGVETFLPLTRNHRQRLQYIHENREDEQRAYEKRSYASQGALFPGYLFARMGEYEWARTKLQLGVSLRPQWVNFGRGPVEVPVEMIERLRAGRVEPSDERDYTTIYPTIKEGEEVKIVEGPLAGLSGVFNRELSGGERVLVLMTVLGALRPVEFERHYVTMTTPLKESAF